MRVDGGQLLVRTLLASGVRHVFTLHGGHLDAVYQAARDTDLRFVDTRHEQAAGHAADGYGMRRVATPYYGNLEEA
jgi:acetolactate synthase-1/2/3 large subunit